MTHTQRRDEDDHDRGVRNDPAGKRRTAQFSVQRGWEKLP